MWMFVAIQKNFTIEFTFAASKTFFICVPNPPSVVHVSAFADCVGLAFDGHLVIAVFSFDCSCHFGGVFGLAPLRWCKHTTKFRIHNTWIKNNLKSVNTSVKNPPSKYLTLSFSVVNFGHVNEFTPPGGERQISFHIFGQS